jgi:methionine-rich copper-binding protein CopC
LAGVRSLFRRTPRLESRGYVRPTAIVLVMLALALAVPATGVFAHAELKSSEPPDGGTLATTPAKITLHFSQNLVTAQSWVAIRDALGGDTQLKVSFDASDKKVMKATTPQLQPGNYTIRWQSLSADDDDFATGNYKLIVLNPDGSKPPGSSDNTGRVLTILGLVILVAAGGFGFWFLKLRKHET